MATTIVSGNLADIQGVPWINAPIEITFVPNPSKPGPVIWADGPFNPGPILIFSDASGNFSIPLPSTDTIQPSNSTWLFSIGPNASAQAVLLNIGVTGVNMDISALFTQRSNALIIQSIRVPRAYAAFQLETPVNMGQLFFNTTLGVFQFWDGAIWDTIIGTAPPPAGIIPDPAGSQSILQPPGTDFTISTSGGGIFAVNGNQIISGNLLLDGVLDGNFTVDGEIALTPNSFAGAQTVDHGLLMTWNVSNFMGETDFINAVGTGGAEGGFRWYNGASNAFYDENSAYIMQLDGFGNLSIAGSLIGPITVSGTLIADNAQFSSCEVNGSPVLTEADLPPGGIPYPPAGIGVSTGSSWAPSIDPTTVPRLNAASNAFTGSMTIGGGLLINGSLITSNANFSVNGVGNTNIGGTLNVVGNSTFAGAVTAMGNVQLGAPSTATATVPLVASDGANLFLDAFGGAVYLNWDYGTGVNFGNGAEAIVGSVDNAGNAHFNGTVTTSAVLSVTGTGNVSVGALNLDFLGGNTGRILSISPTGSIPPDFVIAVLDANSTNYAEILHYTIADDTIRFRPNVICDQTLTVTGAKNFAISHPFRENKNLVHSCIEGPEVAVFYRGEIITRDGLAEVLLPDYFESLTFMEDRSVLLTQIYDDEYPALVLMAASRIENGRFKIKTIGRAKIAWEVKAVRRIGVDRLVVEPDKEIINA